MRDTAFMKKNQHKSVLSGWLVCMPIEWIVKVFIKHQTAEHKEKKATYTF